jgi:7-keto-8-aminopelargonate synthetase-like enzyme
MDARTYASVFRAQSQQQVPLQEAAAALRRAEQQLIQDDQHFYDLVVLEKTSTRLRVRDRRGREFAALDCVTNSYNDLEWVPENRAELVKFVQDAPLSSCISRKIAGLHDVHDKLRREMADFLGYPACVLGTCGYVSQLSTIFALFHAGDVIFSDQHNHSSLVDGCRLSHATVIPFPHRDYDRLEELMKKHRGRFNGAGVLSDGVFSTKGSVADIDHLVTLARRHRALSVIDDTHGVTVLGKEGRGVIDLFHERPDVVTGGFGKALGSFGGFAVASESLATAIDILGRQNVNTSFMSPIVAAQSLINLRWYRAHTAEINGELRGKLRAFNAALGEHGLACYPAPDEHIHPIFCLYRPSESATLKGHKQLIAAGFLPSFFPPPVAPYPSLRFSLHRCLPEDELRRLAGLLGSMEGLFVDSGGRHRDAASAAAPERRRAKLTRHAKHLAGQVPVLRRLLGGEA